MDIQSSVTEPTLAVALPPNLIDLFHHQDGHEPKFDPRLEKIHSNPAVYFVGNFLSQREISYFDEKITLQEKEFKTASTVGADGIIATSEDDTSTSLYLQKGGDSILRHIEAEAAGDSLIDTTLIAITEWIVGQNILTRFSTSDKLKCFDPAKYYLKYVILKHQLSSQFYQIPSNLIPYQNLILSSERSYPRPCWAIC